MKQILFFIIANLVIINLNAQVKKGTILIEGNINYSTVNLYKSYYSNYNSYGSGYNSYGYGSSYGNQYSSRYVEAKSHSFNFSPKVGVFMSESVIVGVGVNYNYVYNKNDYTQRPMTKYKYRENVVSLNPYLTNFHKLTDKLYWSSTLNLLVGLGGSDLSVYSGDNVEIDTDIFKLEANYSLGFSYFVSDKYALVTNFGRIYFKREEMTTSPTVGEDFDNSNQSFGLDFSWNSFTVGVQFFLNR